MPTSTASEIVWPPVGDGRLSALGVVAAGSVWRSKPTLMLAKANRLTRAQDFRLAMREGSHAHSPNLVLHQYVGTGDEPARIGFVVAKRFVKHATGRNLIKRRLRNLVRGRIRQFPVGSVNVFYAKAGIAEVDYSQLENQVGVVLQKMARKRHQAHSGFPQPGSSSVPRG